MKKELQEQLFAKYPLIFQDKDKDKTQSCMFWGIDTGDGWYNLIETLCGQIQWHIDQRVKSLESYNVSVEKGVSWNHVPAPVPPQVVADQVKEKFAGLRFYYHGGDEFIEGLASMAESMSFHICEKCGEKGEYRDGGWVTTLCDSCNGKR